MTLLMTLPITTSPVITSTDSHGQTAVAPVLRPDLGAIADLVTPGTRVLDLGCGDGALLEHLVRHRGVKGRGIENGKRGRGDLMVTVEVAVPAKLTKEQKAAIEAFDAASDESPRAHLGV